MESTSAAVATAAVAINIDCVSKSFVHQVKGSVFAAKDVSIKVQPGEFLTLLGPSGCGKTTTLRMIAGFGLPDTGRISFGDKDVTRLPSNERNIGFVFQNYALFPHLSIFENVAYGLRVRGERAADIQSRVTEVLSQVGLKGYEQQFSSQLSGGEQQRVALARAIVIRPQVLLFDEPLSNLDARLRVQMRQEIRQLQQRLSITTVYVTHDQEEAMAVSDRIAVMNQGSITQQGSAEDLYYRPTSEFVARFVGKVNILPARVTGIDPLKVSVLGQTATSSSALPGMHLGDAVNAVIRPESIALGACADHPDAPQSTVVSCVFLGEKLEIEVECAGQTVQVARHSAVGASLAPGQAVALLLPRDGVAVLAA